MLTLRLLSCFLFLSLISCDNDTKVSSTPSPLPPVEVATITSKPIVEIIKTSLPEHKEIKIPRRAPKGNKITAIRTLTKEFDFETNIKFDIGKRTSEERVLSSSYKAFFNLEIREPSPALHISDFKNSTPALLEQLPDLTLLLETAQIHPYWNKLYALKKKRIVDNAHHLLKLPTKHNYYDCQTILQLQHPTSGRKLVLLQADMDVVTDGSDGDRMPLMPESVTTSTYYQPTTSYSWKKQSKTPNPMIDGYRTRISNAHQELNSPSTSDTRRNWLKSRITMLEKGISEMEKRSFLIADHDPFIVLPIPMIVSKSSYSPNVGDYAVVFYKDSILPAIVGDAGPARKVGEASLRIAQELNPKANSYQRAVSDVDVSYLIFPGSRKKPHRAPDYSDIHSTCQSLLGEIGGLNPTSQLHQWESKFPEVERFPNIPSIPKLE